MGQSAFDPLIRKLEQYAPLSDPERQSICAWRRRVVEYMPEETIAREGDVTENSAVLFSGFAFRQKVLDDGSRQILALHIPGDFIDLHSLVLKPLDHSIAAVNHALVAKIPHTEIIQSMAQHPLLARCFMWDIALDGAVARQWMVTLGRKSAYEQLAHLICELFFRLKRVGLVSQNSFELMLTQPELADICGISPIHVNRSLKALQCDGLVVREKRRIILPDLDPLIEVAGFDPAYLYLLATKP
jgi:CRP-like cAMP-binding protein